jgi:hypothetical protein
MVYGHFGVTGQIKAASCGQVKGGQEVGLA